MRIAPSISRSRATSSSTLTHSDGALLLGQLEVEAPGGRLPGHTQPNYRFAYREYFDDYTHVSVHSDRSLSDFLVSNGFRVVDCRARFPPLTVKGKLPVWPFLIRLVSWHCPGNRSASRCCCARSPGRRRALAGYRNAGTTSRARSLDLPQDSAGAACRA